MMHFDVGQQYYKARIINQTMKLRTSKRLQQYVQLKKTMQLPLKVRLYLSTLQGLINKNQSEQIAKQRVVDLLLVKSFQRASQQQKIDYLAYAIKRLQEQIQREQNQENEVDISKVGMVTINSIETTCMLEQYSFKIAFWSNCKFKFDKLKRLVTVSNKKKTILVSLEQYLIRKSKKSSCTVVFQSISKDVSPQLEKIYLKLKEDRFDVIFEQLFKSIGDSLAETLTRLMHESSDEPQLTEKQDQLDNSQNQKSFAFLTPAQINSYLKDKKRILDRLRVGGFSFKNILSKDTGDCIVKIDRSTKIDKIFKLECEMDLTQKALKSSFLQSVNSRYRYKVDTNILEQFSKKYRAVYEKYIIKGIPYEHICISQQSNTDGEQVYFSKGLDNLMTGNYLQFLIAKVKPSQNNHKSKLVIVASMIANKLINLQVVVAFLLEFTQMIGRSENDLKQEQAEDAFYSIAEGFDLEENEQIDTPDSKTERNQNIANLLISQSKGNHHLRCHFKSHPLQIRVQDYESMRLKQHHFKGVWGRDSKGGMLCINKQMNEQQRKIVKKIVANIGTTIYKIVKSGNFQNCSLPLEIFKKASHLQVIGNNLSFAPLFFDRFYKRQSIDALQRFKYAILLSLSANNLGICLQKPFNPILGETLQGWIGGCPLYMQQISHHPPISSYFFEGRGYKIYGCLDPKVALGLNSISCWGATKTTIQFDDGCKISFKFAKMIISGFIFGDRLFNYEDKTYIYDQQNNFLCIMHFGPRKKGQYRSQATDFVYGKILRVSEQLGGKIICSNSLIEPSKDSKCQLLSELNGIWNECIYFDNQKYIDFEKQLPLTFMREEHPLPSDSKFRPDLSLYIEDNVKKAQEQKDILQHLQRRDRKLREKYQ